MKNNKFSGIINKLFVAFVSFFVISSVVSAADVYHIIHSPEGNALANIQTYSQFYKETSTSTTTNSYKSATDCSNAGGYFNTSDCFYYYYQYNVTCGILDSYRACTLVKGDRTKIYKGASSKYSNATICSTVTLTATVRCRGGSRNGGEFKAKLNQYRGKETVPCDYSGSVGKKTYNGRTYFKGYISSDRCKKSSSVKICDCKVTKTSTNGYLAWDYNTPTLWKAKAKAPNGTTATAYCVNPGRHWPPDGHTYTKVSVATFNISDCKKGVASSAACGFATIMLQAQKKGLSGDYTTMALALRLWASKNNYGDGNLQVGELSTINPIYSTTANRILNNGYRGTKSKDKIKDLIIAKNDTGLKQLQDAIGLYMDAHNGNGDFFSGQVDGPSQAIDISQEGTFEFDISTNFDPNYTINVKVNSKTSGVTLSSSGLTPCNGGYCLHVTGSISHFDRATCTLNSIQYEVTYQDSRDINAAIYLLTPNNKDYQQFIVLDFRKLETSSLQVIAVPKTLRVNCPPKFECLNPDIDYEDQTTGCHNEGVQGTVKDPTVECIINIKELHDNYEYTDLYVHNTTYANNSYCKVTCRETVTYNMFDEESADSTRFIQYTNGLFKGNNLIASMVGDRECSSEINYNAWKNDYEAANEAVRTTWNTYKRYENIHVLTTPRYEFDECSKAASSCECCNCTKCNCTTVDDKESCELCCDYKYAPSCHTSMHWVIWDTKAYTETGPNGNAISSSTSDKDGYIACGGSTCPGHYCNSRDGNPQKWAGAYNSSKSAYENALKKREALVSIIQDCNMYSSYRLNTLDNSGYTRDNKDSIYYESTEGYDFDPVLDYEYDDDYSSNIKIEEESKLTDKSEAKYCVGCVSEKDVGATKEERVDYWVCRGQGTGALCTKQKLTVPINTLAYIQAQKIAYFWQSVEFSSTVPAGDIVTSEDNADDNVLELTDKNIFPLEIGKLSGKYDNKAHHSQVGDKDRKEAVKFEEGDYECDFEVENLITILPNNDEIPDPDDTECYTCGENGKYGFYYRTIDLDNVFPTGVKTGTWSTVRAQHLIEDIESKGESIYTKTPDYEFVITPANIRNIKEYNRDQNMYGEGYNDFNLQCECTTGICYCDSSFLRELGAGGSLSHLVTSYKRNGVEY